MIKVDESYHRLLQIILDHGVDKTDRTGTGTRSIFHHTFVHDMKDGFPLLTTKKMFTKGIITELLWFLGGNTDLRELVNQGNNIWVGDAYKNFKTDFIERNILNSLKVPTKEEFIEKIKTDNQFNNKWGDLGPIYGKQWVNWGGYETIGGKEVEGINKGVNQIQNVIDLLNDNPDSRRIMVNAWNVGEIDKMILPPCHWAFEFYTEELTIQERWECYVNLLNTDAYKGETIKGSTDKDTLNGYYEEFNIPKRKLSLKWHQRSVDTPLGLPFNIASYGFLLEMFAQQVNMVPGRLIGDLTNVHIYQDQMEGVKEQLERDVNLYEPPKLNLNKAEDIFSYKLGDFDMGDYDGYPTIKFPLSN